MTRARMQQCRSCGADVYFLKHHPGGKVAPIDAEPSPDGNIAVDLDGFPPTYEVVGKGKGKGEDLHTNHFMTCPHGPAWARKGSTKDTEVRQ